MTYPSFSVRATLVYPNFIRILTWIEKIVKSRISYSKILLKTPVFQLIFLTIMPYENYTEASTENLIIERNPTDGNIPQLWDFLYAVQSPVRRALPCRRQIS